MENQEKSKKDKKKLIFLLIIPLLLVFVSWFLFKDMFVADEKKKGGNELSVNTPDVNNKGIDTASKLDLYDQLANEEKKESDGKAVFDQVGQINTSIKPEAQPQQDLNIRLKDEVAPIYGGSDPVVPVQNGNRRVRQGQGDPEISTAVYREKKDNGFNSIVLPDGTKKDEAGGYSYYENNTYSPAQQSEISILAETSGQQKIINGGTLKIVIKESFTVNGVQVPAGTVISGIARFNDSRVDIDVRSINIKNTIKYLQLKAFDMDGIEGLQMAVSDAQKVGRNAYNDELSRLESAVDSKIPGYGGQVAGSILRSISRNKREKTPTITIPAGYKMILKS